MGLSIKVNTVCFLKEYVMKSLSFRTVLEKNIYSYMSICLNNYLNENKYFKGDINNFRILYRYLYNKNIMLPIYRSSLIDRVYKMKSNYFFNLINFKESGEKNDLIISSLSTSFASSLLSFSSSYMYYSSYCGSFSSNSFVYGSYNFYNVRKSFSDSYTSSHVNLGSFSHYSSYIGSYASYGSYSFYGSYNFYKAYLNENFDYYFENENNDKKIIFKRNVGYPKSIVFRKKHFKNEELIIQSQNDSEKFFRGFGLELI